MMMVDFEAGDPTGSPLFLRPANAKVSYTRSLKA